MYKKAIDKEKRQSNYESFYLEIGIDKNKLIKKYKDEDRNISGWQCVCNYCLNRAICTPKGIVKECCITGKKCSLFVPDIESIDKEAKI